MAIGFWTSGSAAKTVTRNPAGARKPAAAAGAGSRPVADGSVFRGGGKSSFAAGDDAIVPNARRMEHDNAIRFMLGPGARVGIGEGRSFPAYRAAARLSR